MTRHASTAMGHIEPTARHSPLPWEEEARSSGGTTVVEGRHWDPNDDELVDNIGSVQV